MVRPSKCPGCKTLRSAHSFGKPGKFCTGPPGSQNGSDVASVSSGTNVPGETSQDVLNSLIEVVNNLTTEVKVLKDEGKQLRALVQPTSSASEAPPPRLQCRASALSPRVTLPELRAMEDLRERVEQSRPSWLGRLRVRRQRHGIQSRTPHSHRSGCLGVFSAGFNVG